MKKPDFISQPDWLFLNKNYPNNLEEVVKKLENGYPIQYLIGNVDFLNTNIKVDKRVLIPRFETEYLVEKTINYASKMFNGKINVIDLGTGSGCIAIALKKNLDCNMTALDISEYALELASDNAQSNNVDIVFKNKNMIDELEYNYDIIISNPPYIPKDGYVEEGVKENEPACALFADNNGLFYYEEILKNHLCKLNKPGLMAFEIGDHQKEELIEILNQYPKIKYKFETDLQNLPRYLFIFNE